MKYYTMEEHDTRVDMAKLLLTVIPVGLVTLYNLGVAVYNSTIDVRFKRKIKKGLEKGSVIKFGEDDYKEVPDKKIWPIFAEFNQTGDEVKLAADLKVLGFELEGFPRRA
jgi:hypothetical protein